MTKEITLKCKNCEKPFSYSEEAYRLMAEKGESQFLRCSECRQSHSKEIREVKIPYSPLKKRAIPGWNFHQLEYTSHGERILQEEEKEKVDYSENLTITDEEILALYQKFQENQVVVLAAPTGAGKSTFVPARLIEPPESYSGEFIECLIRQGQIIITEPRILATIRVPGTTADMLGSSVGPGHLIGHRHSGEDLSNRWNLGITITDGTLPNWLREGKLDQYSLIMVDEAHERSCNIDWNLGTLRRELPKYPQLRLIISSATINTQKFLDAFREMNVSAELLDLSYLEERRKFKNYFHFWKDENIYRLSKEGKLEKVKDCYCWLCQKSMKEKEEFWKNQKDEISEPELPEITASLITKILTETKEGDILVFLHGEKAINETVKKIRARWGNRIDAIPAYRRIQEDVERELVKETTKRRVIVGTNLLETSLTLQGAVYGIDSGFIKEAKWEPETQIFTLPTERHSQDGRKQRWGRLARTEDGYIYNLYTKEEFEKAEKHTAPEITRSCLEDSLVNLKGAGITKVEQFPWMERLSSHPQMEKEIKRANLALKEKGVIDQKEEITERALELLGIPRQAGEAFFLVSADEQGILFEAMIALWLMSTREGEARTGANLYSSGLGLLTWEPEWDAKKWPAKTKAKVWALHQGLRAGCQDDLDFVTKLAVCFNKARAKGLAKEWAEHYFINYENLEKVISEVDELIIEKFGEEREESAREIDTTQLDKIRSLMIAVWIERIVNLKPGEPITYPVAGKKKVGVVSRLCAGNWQEKKQAIVAAAIEEKAIVDGYPQKVPTASFMVQLPGQVRKADQAGLFTEQISIDDFTESKRETFALGKRISDTLEVKIDQVKGDPVGKGGWIVGKTEEDFEIPIELREMSLSPWGPGLERIEGQTLTLTIKDFDEEGLPQLSNVERIIEDLRKLREEISESERATKVSQRNFVELPGFVVEINEEKEKAVVVVLRENGVLHPFEVAQIYVPGSDLKNLRIEEGVTVRLFRRTDRDEIPLEHLNDEEIKSKPKNWQLQEEKGEILVPLCLDDKNLKDWPARPEAIDFVKRHSWQYCFNAQIRVAFVAKAEISWSPIQYLRKSQDYDIHKITGKFIGRKGENIKNLIAEEPARVEISCFTVTVRAQSEDARRIVCQRVNKWFKEKFGITLEWVFSENNFE